MSERDNLADAIWKAILADKRLERARSKLSIHEIRLIVGHCLDAASPRVTDAMLARALRKYHGVSTPYSISDDYAEKMKAALHAALDETTEAAS